MYVWLWPTLPICINALWGAAFAHVAHARSMSIVLFVFFIAAITALDTQQQQPCVCVNLMYAWTLCEPYVCMSLMYAWTLCMRDVMYAWALCMREPYVCVSLIWTLCMREPYVNLMYAWALRMREPYVRVNLMYAWTLCMREHTHTHPFSLMFHTMVLLSIFASAALDQ